MGELIEWSKAMATAFAKSTRSLRAFSLSMQQVSESIMKSFAPTFQSIHEASQRAIEQIGTNFFAWRKIVIEVTLEGPHLDFWEHWTGPAGDQPGGIFPPRIFDEPCRNWTSLLRGTTNGFTYEEFGGERLFFNRVGDRAVLRCVAAYRDRGQLRAFLNWIRPQVREGVIMVRNMGGRSWSGNYYFDGKARRLKIPESNPEMAFEFIGYNFPGEPLDESDEESGV